MSVPQADFASTRIQPAARLLLATSAIALLCLSCHSAGFQPQRSWGGALTGGRSRFNQSCGPACGATMSPSTGEILAPAVTRLGPVAEKLVQTGEAVQGILAIQRLLTEAELAAVQLVVEQCVAQVHADVNESYQKRDGGSPFKNGKFPNDAECKQVVRLDEYGDEVTLAQELGILKHAAAFACIEGRLPARLRDHFSIEPRYQGEPKLKGAVLTNNKLGSLKPDIVLHATRNATRLQCVLEFKFPCLERHRLEPMRAPGVQEQLEGYQALSQQCRVGLVTPTGLKFYEGT